MALPLFAITLFVSAFLLFLVQPLIGKMILPTLGGTPQVWNTCMMFFQTTLLLGYFYTHATSKLPLRRQMLIHCCFLIVPLLFVLPPLGPFNISGWNPPPGANPIWSTLFQLAFMVGVPFLVVSTSAPLLQKWFSHTGHPAAKDPYFLYAASNLGSLLSLVLYPFMIEPWLKLGAQAWVWTVAYVILGGMIAACATLVVKFGVLKLQFASGPSTSAPPRETPAREPVASQVAPAKQSTAVKAGAAPSTSHSTAVTRKKGFKKPAKPSHAPAPIPSVETYLPRDEAVTPLRQLRWVLLAFAPSSLMLGVTSYCSVDLSPFPLLWVIPLALYLLSFILVFSKWPIPWVGTPHRIVLYLTPVAVCFLLWIYLQPGFDPFKATIVSFVGFFGLAMMCHGELARDRPPPAHLTKYFLLLSVGGALGGIFNGLLAPVLFVGVVEYPLAIVVAALLKPAEKSNGWFDDLVVSAFPSLDTWSRDTGDKMAMSFGKQPPHTPWVLNLFIDLFVAAFVYGLTWFLRDRMTNDTMVSILKFLGYSHEAAVDALDRNIILLFYYGLPMLVCLLVGFNRGTRMGLCVAALLLASVAFTGRDGQLLYSGRSYFGVLRVYMDLDIGATLSDDEIDKVKPSLKFPETEFITTKGRRLEPFAPYTFLMHGTTYHGKNFHYPPELRRLATTYYHRKGPVGVIMERWNWGSPGLARYTEEEIKANPKLKAPLQNTYYADMRLPVSMVGLGATPLGTAAFPVDQITACWSEPPYATIGLGTGTMASYGRWLQHVTFYEIDENIRNFSLPPSKKYVLRDLIVNNPKIVGQTVDVKRDINDPFFTYLIDAIRRGVNIEVIMGDARQSMKREEPSASAMYAMPEGDNVLPSADLPMYSKHINTSKAFAQRDNYYKVIEVDAFSSDAIPIHLTTKEGIELYFSKLAPDGVVNMHTSNRHMNLVLPIVDIADALKKKWRVGHDVGGRAPYLGHFGSEYVMLANTDTVKQGELTGVLVEYPLLPKDQTRVQLGAGFFQEWSTTTYPMNRPDGRIPQGQVFLPVRMNLWTDDFSNIVSILR